MSKIKQWLDKFFGISERGSNFKTEFLGGLVNYMVICYVVIVIPTTLVGGGTEVMWNAVFIATILSAIIGTLIMALYGKLPLVLAPGIGLCAYLASLVSSGMYTYAQAMAMALIAGILFIIVTIFKLREKITNSIPKCVKYAMPAGIGLFIASIGLNDSNSGLIAFFSNGPTYMINGDWVLWSAIVSLVSFVIMAVLYLKKVKGSILYGILSGTVLNVVIELCRGLNPFEVLWKTNWLPQFGDLAQGTLFQFDFVGLFSGKGFLGILSVLMIIFSFFIVDMFDTVGTLYSATKRAGMVGEDDQIPNYARAMWADGISSVVSACIGVPGCTTYVESNAGIETGARTGLSSVWACIFFILTLFLSPLVRLIPASATAPALILVGVIMFSSILDVNLNDLYEAIPAVLTVLIMPLSGNISYGIAVGFITHTAIMLFTGRYKELNVFSYICTALFLLFFFLNNIA